MKKKLLLALIATAMLPLHAHAKQITYMDAGCNMTAYLLMTAQERLKDKPTVKPHKVKKVQSHVEDDVDQNELYLLAHLIWNETGILGEKAMIYTGSVVLNRVNYPRYYPNNIHDVIFQHGQYQCTWDGHFWREPSITAWNVADMLLRHGSYLPHNILFQAEFEQGDFVYEKIGNTYYCGLY